VSRAPGFKEEGYPPAAGAANVEDIRPLVTTPSSDSRTWMSRRCGPLASRPTRVFRRHRFFLNGKGLRARSACLRTYNAYLIAEVVRPDPSRLFARILPLNYIDLAVADSPGVGDRCAKAIAFSENPRVGQPSVHTAHWDRCGRVRRPGVPVCMHIGSSSRLLTTSTTRRQRCS